MNHQPTVAFFPEPGAWGPTNNLVAMGNHLRERGIRVVFVVEESFEGELEKRGFEEALSAKLSAAPGRIKGADLIEQLVRTSAPVPAA